MEYQLAHAIPVLERAPAVIRTMLLGLPDEWVMSSEGGDSWSPYDVVGHLAYLEASDWIGRTRILLAYGTSRAFDPVDRIAMFEASKGKSLLQLLDEFAALRAQSLDDLRALNLTAAHFSKPGLHPALGEVSLGQLLAAWVVHDLNHIHQIAQTMARQYREAVGPWRQYLLVLD